MRILTILLLLIMPLFSNAQSKVMRELSDSYPDAFVLMFYHSSLNMLNIDDDPDFARMIHDIEKIKVLRIDKEEDNFNSEALSTLKKELADRDFEELMIVKSKDYDIGVYLHEDGDDIEGFFLIMDENETFMAIDVLGSMPVGDISQLVNKIKDVNEF
ncbi:MAG: hypothetical protein DRI71_11535 [Bacteroidetes bacterium]|nr:MAG: hypothetical protein DRI71_11535 [Bacteroidota bacterium]